MMASPAAKRRKIDENAAQMNEGYDTGLFLNSTDANRYLCLMYANIQVYFSVKHILTIYIF